LVVKFFAPFKANKSSQGAEFFGFAFEHTHQANQGKQVFITILSLPV